VVAFWLEMALPSAVRGPVWPVGANSGDAIGVAAVLSDFTVAGEVKKTDRGFGGIPGKLLVWWEKIV
jgi:hypothetical protein